MNIQCIPTPQMFCQTAATPVVPNAVAGLARWYRTEDITGIEYDPVEVWSDYSGYQDATQITATNQPTVFNTNTNKCIHLDGADDFMNIGEITTIRAVFIVCRYTATNSNSAVILGHDTLYHWHGGHVGVGDQDKVISTLYAHANVTGGSALNNGAAAAPTAIDKPTDWAVLAFRTTGNVTASNFGHDRFYYNTPIRMMELAIYTSAVSDADFNGVAAWLAAKFAADL